MYYMGESMKTAAARINFAVRLANMDLGNLRPGDWMNLKDDLSTFLGGRAGEQTSIANLGGILATPFAEPLPQNYKTEDFQALQSDFKSIFDGIKATTIPTVHIEGDFYLADFRPETVICVSGPTRDMADIVLLALLNKEPSNRVLRCPECNTLFYRIKKQAYCSRTCVNRATVREWRKTKEGQRSESENAHKRYVKRMKAKHGQNVKVKRMEAKHGKKKREG